MPADEQIIAQEHNQPTAAPQQSAKQARSRQSDDGPEILPCMEHFVTLVRKAKRPGLALLLVERASATSLPEVAALTDAAKGILAVQSRKAMFHAVAKLGSDVQQRIERAAERVVLLDDEYGAQAVQSLLDDEDINDAAIMAAPSDRYSRALFLCLALLCPVGQVAGLDGCALESRSGALRVASFQGHLPQRLAESGHAEAQGQAGQFRHDFVG